ncbi:hypothetical protein BST33_03200 [Mycolicibacter minnesotensis]|uniref:Uncharacterized protein n=1 Tax=Mycolicibacter minnesotensis TaxID=1118379 RepID=A0AA91RNR1_9MYCO|nr:hypothetical protein BST33_03200 [Mycolicibacter minnesotensis]
MVRKLERGTQDVKPHSSEVDCYFQVVDDADGTRLLHLSTFGSDGRASAPKSSQSIQIDEEMAHQLVALLVETFPRAQPDVLRGEA